MNDQKYIQVVNFSEFEKVFGGLIEDKKTFLAYFHGDYDETGHSWCGDCNDSKPIIEEASQLLKEKVDPVLFKFPIVRENWKDKSFLYRTHPKLKLTNIPTVILFQKGAEFARLVEGALLDKENVLDLFGLIV